MTSSVRSHFLHSMSTCHSSRAVTTRLVEFQCGQSYRTSQIPSNTALRWHNMVPGLAGLAGLMLKCRESTGGQLTQARPTLAMLMRLNSSRVVPWAETELPPTEVLLGSCDKWCGCLCSGAQNSLPATTKVCICSKDLYKATSVKAHRGR